MIMNSETKRGFSPIAALCEAFYACSAIILAWLTLLDNSYAQSQCGAAADADIVIMIDIGGGANAELIAQQKAGVLELVNYFNSATVKPKIALGSYNSVCTGYTQCADPGFNHARIVTALSSDYTAAIAQLQPGSGIVGGGVNGAGIGGGNIEKVLTVSNSHLQSNGSPATPNYVILFADGNPTFPGYYWPEQYYPYYWPCPGTPACTSWQQSGFPCGNLPNGCCDNYVCPPAENAGKAAAQQLTAAGTTRFTVHLGENNWGGPAYLANDISSGPGYSYAGLSGLQELFNSIAEQITCNDGLSCTVDSCGTNGECVFTELDSDGDSVGDCSDLCPLDPNKAAPGITGCGNSDQDSDGDGEPDLTDGCPNDPNKTEPGLCGCGVPEVPAGQQCSPTPPTDSDGDGVPDSEDGCPFDPNKSSTGLCGCGVPEPAPGEQCPGVPPPSNAACSVVDVTGYKFSFTAANTGQDAQIKRLLRTLRSRLEDCKNQTRTRRFIAKTRVDSQKALDANSSQSASIPFAIVSCPPGTLGCQSSPINFSSTNYASQSDFLRDLSIKTIKRIRSCTRSGGQCRGSVSECKRRSLIRRRQIIKDRQLALQLHAENLATSSAVPSSSFSCN